MAREAYRVGSPGGCLRLGPAWARLSSPKAKMFRSFPRAHTPHTPRAKPSTPTSKGKLIPCRPLAMPTQARHTGKGARPEAVRALERSWAPATDSPPALGQKQNGHGVWQADTRPWYWLGGSRGPRARGRSAGRGLGREKALTSRTECLCALLGVGRVLWARSKGGGLLFREVRFLSPNTQLKSAQIPLRPREGWEGPHTAPGVLGHGQPPIARSASTRCQRT